MPLKNLVTAPGDASGALKVNYNDLVRTLRQILKMRGDGNVQVSWVGGIPIISLKADRVTTMVAFATSDIAGATGDITSGTGLTPGIGDVQPCTFDGTKWLATSDSTVKAQNLSLDTITANVPLQFKKVKGVWICDWEDCPSS